jgi:hypothetical protein
MATEHLFILLCYSALSLFTGNYRGQAARPRADPLTLDADDVLRVVGHGRQDLGAGAL